jgi:hypothetical protein
LEKGARQGTTRYRRWNQDVRTLRLSDQRTKINCGFQNLQFRLLLRCENGAIAASITLVLRGEVALNGLDFQVAHAQCQRIDWVGVLLIANLALHFRNAALLARYVILVSCDSAHHGIDLRVGKR